MIKKIAIVLGAFLWGIIIFRIALGLHFPTDELGKKIRSEFEKSTKSEMQMDISSLSLAGLIGLEANQTTIYKKDKDDQAVPYLFIDSLAVVLNPFQAFTGDLGAHISSNFMNGTIEGDVSGDSFNPKNIAMDWSLSDLSLELFPVETENFSANLGGKLSSTFKLDTPINEFHKNANGMLRVDIKNLSINEAKAQGIALPNLTFSEAKLLGKIKNGKVSLDGTSFISESLGIAISGSITLAKNIGRSRLRLVLDITLGDEFALISKMIPELKESKQPDGSYQINVVGTLNNLRLRDGNDKSKKGNNNRKKKNQDQSIEERDEPITPKISPEEKRKQRRERMEKRKKEREDRKNRANEEKEENIGEEENEDDNMNEDEPPERVLRPDMSRSQVRDLPLRPKFDREPDEEDGNDDEFIEEDIQEPVQEPEDDADEGNEEDPDDE